MFVSQVVVANESVAFRMPPIVYISALAKCSCESKSMEVVSFQSVKFQLLALNEFCGAGSLGCIVHRIFSFNKFINTKTRQPPR